MQGSDFQQYFDKYSFLQKHFLGIFAIDTIPRILKNRQFCICNTDTSDGKGIHWFCFIRTSKTTIECFDSLGVNYQKKKILQENCKFRNVTNIHFNETIFQKNDSNSCGLFTIYFIIERMFNLDIEFEELLEDIFSEDLNSNEEKVLKFCKDILIDNGSD
jgi:hypothetical protein